MAVVIRMARAGTKKAPFYHIVATDSRKPRDGKFLEAIGTWDPVAEKLSLNDERFAYWRSKGALPSETVHLLTLRAAKAAKPSA